MRDFIVRLASMKLAEMKFNVAITTQYIRLPKSYSTKEMTLLEIKDMLKDHVKRPGDFLFGFSNLMFVFEALPKHLDNIEKSYVMKIEITPLYKGMSEENFRQIIKASRLMSY